ncbi:LirA/MavJ family T4SS effector [Legionella longbeachae]|uniref:DUF5636 domain-containing protein n=1 Tax=Legionella longbeachae serogroup 1 (strain NSW150) TaxID=661367 RepID=D3HPT4_LEGLN|nr:LirA/MavJ family T4SS effector [Legionella longbeachae]VEE01420.1 Uncharacterised protein [Legionella oakridgensis]HBD7396138.1 hypothetical protein [Legionella pneumophila]ARB92216.1 hypothetical protein A6J40_08525 [Legionella longbeachae]ARM34603.1 hypothetical protein B0B39_14195 [Legionella longbeachae]EEZ96102.1 conserved hypothetical protein [Legionella longbeachae D-4968]
MFFKKDPTLQQNKLGLLEDELKKSLKGDLLNNTSFISNCVKIENFLMDVEAVEHQLKSLNDLLATKLKNSNLKPGEKRATKQLRTLIQELLISAGFRSGMIQTVGDKGLSKEDFMFLTASGFMLKDSSLRGKPHGEFTHALQWCLIILKQQEDPSFLDNMEIKDICENIFKLLGHENSTTTHPFNCWDQLVDRAGADDARSPEWLSEHIQKDENTIYPLLAKIISLRTQKDSKAHLEQKLKNPPERYEKHPEIENILMPKLNK